MLATKNAPFTAEGFTPTKFSTADDKAKFLNNLVGFINSGFKRTKFTKSLYTRLSMTFGHIAHYNIEGFHDTWFATTDNQKRWLRHVLGYRSCGLAELTFTDAEQAFQKWLREK